MVIEGYDIHKTSKRKEKIDEGDEMDGGKPDISEEHHEHQYLGQMYQYHKNIMSPEDLAMSPEGDMDTLVRNVAGLINYGQILITGGGHANAKVNREGRDEPLGDKFFLKTAGKCYPVKVDANGVPLKAEYDGEGKQIKELGNMNDAKAACEAANDSGSCDFIYYKKVGWRDDEPDSQENKALPEGGSKTKYTATVQNLENKKARDKQKRYVYIDNLPTGTIPGLGQLKGFKGLIPGMIENLGAFNPMALMNAISEPAVPPCIKIDMETIKFNDEGSNHEWHHTYNRDQHWVTISDVDEIDPCSFSVDNTGVARNPINGRTKTGCPRSAGGKHTEGYKNLFNKDFKHFKKFLDVKDKPIAKLFHTSFGLLLAYILWRVLRKETKL